MEIRDLTEKFGIYTKHTINYTNSSPEIIDLMPRQGFLARAVDYLKVFCVPKVKINVRIVNPKKLDDLA